MPEAKATSTETPGAEATTVHRLPDSYRPVRMPMVVDTGEAATVVSVKPVVLAAPGRGKDLQVRVSAPILGHGLPVIVFSHGFGSSLEGYRRRARADHGRPGHQRRHGHAPQARSLGQRQGDEDPYSREFWIEDAGSGTWAPNAVDYGAPTSAID